ncbi:uncharacterized protein LOC129567252 [Sitodiplosis mosellana]|uniref:uncharacterized protein LOC129567252 n=1 Tax=Sitodiplosis mosellana TaxID=263140 RepID=UPI002444B1B7|nr:uncharacterized protein LOC129567252 [Sitodiplosis mosellana]
METQVEDFNWNLRLFLDVLGSYQTKVNKANPATLELLEKTLDSISDLIGNVEEVTSAGQGDAIVCSFDETNFEVKRTIFCRICKVDIAASRLSYLLHCADPKHNTNLIDRRSTQGSALDQNGVFDSNNNSKGDHVDLGAKKNNAPIQHQSYHQKPLQSTKEANNSAYINSMADLIASLDARKKSDVVKTSGLKENNGNNNGIRSDKVVVPTVIPNVFDDNIYDFIELIGKQGDPTKVNGPSRVNVPQKENEPPKASSINSKYGFNKGDPANKIPSESDHPSAMRPNSLLSWRERSLNESAPSAWRAKNDGSDAATVVTSTPVTDAVPVATAPKPATIAKVFPTPVTKSIIQNGAVLSGAGVKPCATYELNNLYIKFPHLNPNKVANPLKPVPLKDVKRPAATNKDGKTQKIDDPKLKDFFDKVNKEHAKKSQQQLNSTQLKKSELTNSLMSLPVFANNNTTGEHQAMNRMPPRSASSFNLTGITRIEGSNPQKGSRKSSPQVNGQNGNNRNQNANAKIKGSQGQNGSSPSSTPNDPKSKGAIPKQKNTPQASASNQKSTNDSSKSNQNSQKKDVTSKPAKPNEMSAVPKDPAPVVNHEQLKRFFSGDLSALISLMVSLNMRRDKTATQQKITESIQVALKPRYETVNCHMIGSHVYNIAKGGLATLDVYLDLHKSFNTDKSGQVFVNGMNDTLKFLSNSGEWSDAKCSEQTRYGILSATHTATSLKCNFSFGTGVGVRNTDVINSLFTAQPVARQMVISVRLALQEGSNGDWAKLFGGYIVTLLVIFYLQIAGKLPSVLSLQSDSSLEPAKCGENLVHFANPTNVTICKDRVRDLLIGFFDYYANFDFFNKIISPFEGREINQNFRNCPVDSLSRSMRRFKSLIDTEPHRWTNNRMCIQDIFEHKRNVSQAIHTKEVKAFADFCSKALFAIREAGNAVKY